MDMDDWDSVDGIETDLYTFGAVVYPDGAVTYKCVYDDTYIYFSFMIPATIPLQCHQQPYVPLHCHNVQGWNAMATFYNMGGCPDASSTAHATPVSCPMRRIPG
jgi:hypothetical protein